MNNNLLNLFKPREIKKINNMYLKDGRLYVNDKKVQKENLHHLVYLALKNQKYLDMIAHHISNDFICCFSSITVGDVINTNNTKLMYDYAMVLSQISKTKFLEIEMLCDRIFLLKDGPKLAEFGINIASADHDEIENYLFNLGDMDSLYEYAFNFAFANLNNVSELVVRNAESTNSIKHLAKFATIKSMPTLELEKKMIEIQSKTNDINNAKYLFKYAYNAKKIHNKEELTKLMAATNNIEYIALYALLIDPLVMNNIGDINDLLNLVEKSKEEFIDIKNYITLIDEFNKINDSKKVYVNTKKPKVLTI